MELIITCLQYFCYGYTAVSLPAFLIVIGFAYWANKQNEKYYKSLYKKDKDSE